MYRIILTQRAKIDLERSYNYIYYNLANPIAAKRFKDKIPKSISNLQIFPFMGKQFNQTNLRYIYFKNYLIIYSVKNKNFEILRIIHKRQYLKNIIY